MALMVSVCYIRNVLTAETQLGRKRPFGPLGGAFVPKRNRFQSIDGHISCPDRRK